MIVAEDSKELTGEELSQPQEQRNAGILQAWMPRWVTNTFYNYSRILAEFQERDMSVDSLPRAHGEPAVIVGSGPSLDKAAPLLGRWKGAVFATLSNARIPTRWGHQPEYVCCFDAGDGSDAFLQDGYDWSGSMLLTHPAVSPYVFDLWRWEKRYYIQMHLGSQWFDLVNPIVFGGYKRWRDKKPADIRIAIENAGCTVNNAIQLAHWLGYGPLFLVGVDFGYPDNLTRATGYRWDKETGDWIEESGGDVRIALKHRYLHTSNNGILTSDEQIEYKMAMLNLWKLDGPHLIDCSAGIVTELPKANFEEVVENGGRGYEHLYRGKAEIAALVDSVLHGLKIVPPPGADDQTNKDAGNEDHVGVRSAPAGSHDENGGRPAT